MINIFQPSLATEELEAVKKVFESSWLGKGKLTDRFELEFSSFVKERRESFVSTNCCTEGLFQAIKLLNIGPGDEVIVPSPSFIAAANAVMDNGAELIFCDVDEEYMNATAKTIEKKITKKTKAIFLLHYSVPCEMDEILALAKQHNIFIIEDTASSPFSTYKGKSTGTFGDIGTWSFDAMKILVCGDGGMVYCKTIEMAEKLSRQLYLGLKTSSGFANKLDSKWWEFDIDCYGRRAIMNDITAAIALEQLKKVPNFLRQRKKVYDFYNENLKDLDWLILRTDVPDHTTISYYFYRIQTRNSDHRDQLAVFLKENGIYTTFRYYPLHLVKFYNSNQTLPISEKLASCSLNLPLHQNISDEDMCKVVEKIREFGRKI